MEQQLILGALVALFIVWRITKRIKTLIVWTITIVIIATIYFGVIEGQAEGMPTPNSNQTYLGEGTQNDLK